MKITDPGLAIIQASTSGDLASLDELVLTIQPGVFNLAVRMLGNSDDAADATQEILIKVVTHLGGFRAEASFTTWVYQVARNHLLTAVTRNQESPEVSLEGLAESLQAGLDFVTERALRDGQAQVIGPQDKAEARQIALGCTQKMLMALDREQRLVYLLDAVFGLPSKVAAEVVGIAPQAYRQRLSRARVRLEGFMESACGLVNEQAACRCERQVPAVRHVRGAHAGHATHRLAIVHQDTLDAEHHFAAFSRMHDAAAVFRAHPDYQAPDRLLAAIRAVLSREGYWEGRPFH